MLSRIILRWLPEALCGLIIYSYAGTFWDDVALVAAVMYYLLSLFMLSTKMGWSVIQYQLIKGEIFCVEFMIDVPILLALSVFAYASGLPFLGGLLGLNVVWTAYRIPFMRRIASVRLDAEEAGQ